MALKGEVVLAIRELQLKGGGEPFGIQYHRLPGDYPNAPRGCFPRTGTQLRVVHEVIPVLARRVAPTEAKPFIVGPPGDGAAVGPGFGLGDLQHLDHAVGVLAQQLQRVGFDAKADRC